MKQAKRFSSGRTNRKFLSDDRKQTPFQVGRNASTMHSVFFCTIELLILARKHSTMALPAKSKNKTKNGLGRTTQSKTGIARCKKGQITGGCYPLRCAGWNPAAITWFIYQPATQYGFTNWDDDVYVTENPIIAHPENTHQMLTTPIGGNYHPLTIYSLAYDYKLNRATAQRNAKGPPVPYGEYLFFISSIFCSGILFCLLA